MEKYKIAVVTSHPIQHQAPLFQELGRHPEIDATVCFFWDFGVGKESFDPAFGRKIKWDIPLLNGYHYKFFRNFSLKPSSGFFGQINPGIIRELVKNRYDAVFIFGWNSLSNWLAFLTCFIARTPVFLRGENPLNQEIFKSPLKVKTKKIILGWLFRRISAFLYIGEENKKFFQYYGVPPSKLFFCPYADDNERYIAEAKKFGPQKLKFKEELGIAKKKTVIFFAGKLIDKKRPLDLIMAYQRINNTDVALAILGDGPLRPALEDYVRANNVKDVYFIGFKNLTELSQYYSFADLLVLPSGGGETWGLVVNIAMCSGLPVIVSDVVGCGPDLVKNGINGYVFPMGNIEKLSEQIGDLVGNSQRREKFGQEGFKIVQNYSYKNDVRGILTALSKIVKK